MIRNLLWESAKNCPPRAESQAPGYDEHLVWRAGPDHLALATRRAEKGRLHDPRPNIALTPDEQAAFFRDHHKCALATHDREGFPHIVAMNYVARDGAFYMTSYGKAQKVLNIRRNPKVALMVEAGDAYGELRGVMVRGHCEVIDEPGAVTAAFAARLETQSRRPGVQPGAVASAPKRVVLKVVFTR